MCSVRFFEPHVLSTSRVPSPTKKEGESAVLRAAHSLPVVYSTPHKLSPTNEERECAVQKTAHSLPVVYPLAYRFLQNSTENVWFEEPHILCPLHTVSRETGERTCGSKNLTFSVSRAQFPTERERECAVLRTAHSLPLASCFLRDGTGNMQFEEPHIPCPSCTTFHKIL